jgi:hypothetical protein
MMEMEMPYTWTIVLARKSLSQFDDFYGFLVFFAMLIDVGLISVIFKLMAKA